jgi:hypothetical protein
MVEGGPGSAGSVPGRTAGVETGQYTEGDYGAAGTVRAEHEAETDEQQSPRR